MGAPLLLPTERQVRDDAIVAAYRGGATQEALAAKFGVGVWSVRKALAAADAFPTKEEARRRRLAASTSPSAIAKRANSNRRPLSDRFFSKVVVSDGCWAWIGAKDGHGYPQLRVEGRNRTAAHISLELHGYPRPSTDACSLHSCDNPECTNPRHLRWGTHRENTHDALSRGRLNLRGLELGRGRG